MISLQTTMDKFAIGLSMICTIHCLITPLFLLYLPSMAVLGLEGEFLHQAMVMIVIPTSVLSLALGCKHHKKHRFFVYGSIGLCLLILAIVLENIFMAEKFLTVIGTGFIAYSHYQNFRLCHTEKSCKCS